MTNDRRPDIVHGSTPHEGSAPFAQSGKASAPRSGARAVGSGGSLVYRGALGLGAALVLLLLWSGSGYRAEPLAWDVPSTPELEELDDAALPRERTRLLSRRRSLESKLRAAVPRGSYVVVDQTHNRLYLKRGEETVIEATCSAGSGFVLRERDGGERVWVFDTPRGKFRVISKLVNPIWRKPDWAFIEEGLPVPDDPSERFERGVLGEYALYFGDGYMIHGTLYERLLGRSVTHGCIRLGRDDLRKVYAATTVGTPIYVF